MRVCEFGLVVLEGRRYRKLMRLLLFFGIVEYFFLTYMSRCMCSPRHRHGRRTARYCAGRERTASKFASGLGRYRLFSHVAELKTYTGGRRRMPRPHTRQVNEARRPNRALPSPTSSPEPCQPSTTLPASTSPPVGIQKAAGVIGDEGAGSRRWEEVIGDESVAPREAE